jgi:hypothetical protein
MGNEVEEGGEEEEGEVLNCLSLFVCFGAGRLPFNSILNGL